ncbi:flagellar basal-body rod protein FlgF [Algihabitans albus]|uniref:flagellar basal-body rod protein FlgF n=1 Tax=Algihabitans albus TaxID=2164067 RepID=UPI000E5CCB8C|nr:flagellar basal-body rod protein FlgF [Algihabitans albus]
METPGYVALSRQAALRRELDVISNNIANMDTPGYRGESMLFVEYLANTKDKVPAGLRKISYVQDIATVRDLSEGAKTATDNPLDLAISGDGFFAVESENGERYTRNGAFMLDADGQIVTTSGLPLLNEAGQPMVVPDTAGRIDVARDGTVSYHEQAGGDAVQVGRIRLVQFENEYALKKDADVLFRADDQAALPADGSEILQGFIEKSNVKGVVEMTKLIQTVNSYQSAGKMVESEHERQRRAIQTLAGRSA